MEVTEAKDAKQFACAMCGYVLASRCEARFIVPVGSQVHVSGECVRLRCPKCGRTRLWMPTQKAG